MTAARGGALPDPAFWQGRRVLLTGHTGFKGSWLTCWLRQLGAEVMGVSLPEPPTEPSLWEQLDLRDVADHPRRHHDGRLDRRQPATSIRRSCSISPPSRSSRSATSSPR